MSLSRTATGTFALLTAGVLVGAGAGTAHASADQHGAIAISFRTGAVASAVNYPSPAEAGRAADARCGGGRDCSAYVYFVNGCGAVAQAPDDSIAWAWGVNREDAEQSAINGLGLRAPKFPSLGSAVPGAAHIVLSDCTETGGPTAPGGRTLPKP
ncbi:hypothetical protein BJY24_004884 [Nocardia transvalensis]|uniref:DUF4189 domain-containing protein n=1 Tax=Nocardia transvalensis TaxID=37333 RepID=A0A7W9PH54_9NOCA|nr:DUF4189 domain-containing protein [Nocardia transvalensis]MBB5915972.1 hypothetical protein [Nocardia transvalensis]